MQGDPRTTAAPASHLPRSITPQPTSASLRSLTTDTVAVRYHVISTPRDSDCESGIGQTSLQLNVSGTSRSTGVAATAHRGRRRRASEEERHRRNKYRKRRNRIGLLLVFALILLFAGLVICANKKEYIAGVTISVIGVLLGSSSMVLCLLTTDSCERVHGFRERVSSYSRTSRHRNNGDASVDRRRTAPRRTDGASATVSAANSTMNVHDNLLIHPLPPTAVCNISGDFLDHLPPPTYETAEILRREDMAIEHSLVGDIPGAVGGAGDYQYYKVSPHDGNGTVHSSTTNLAGTSSAAASTSHLCEECVQRQQSMEPSPRPSVGEEQVLIAPAIVVELPTYDEAIAEDS